MTQLIHVACVIVSFIYVIHASSNDECICNSYTPSYAQNRRLSRKNNVEFYHHEDLDMKDNHGEKYKRPKANGRLSFKEVHDLVKSEVNSNHNGYCNSDQIHVSLGDDDTSLIITYASASTSTDSSVLYSTSIDTFNSNGKGTTVTGYSMSYSELMYFVSNLWAPTMGAPERSADEIVKIENTAAWAYSWIDGVKEEWASYKSVTSATSAYQSYNNPYAIYDSPIIHRVVLTNLIPGTTYYYAVSGSCDVYETVIPVLGKYPMSVGLTVDLGQTNVSYASMAALEALDPDVILLPGDLSYSDGYPYLWDSWANLMQSLASKIPILTTTGNHEVAMGENSLSHMARYPTPHRGSGSTNPCYYGKAVGVMNVIALCSYSGFTPESLQYQWFENYLNTSIDRDVTPWVVVIMHAPFYNSNNGHWMEAELMRRNIEPLMYQYGVDIVLDGHIHAYERTYPVYNNTVDTCGTTYLNIGDGGNYEGTYTDWKTAPEWSAFRESSFGVGELLIENSTHIKYSWHRHACQSNSPGSPDYNMDFNETCMTYDDTSAQAMITTDTIYITRPVTCPNHYTSTATSTSSTSSSASKGFTLSYLEKVLLSLTIAFFVTTVCSMSVLFRLYCCSSSKGNSDSKLTKSIISVEETSNAILGGNKV